MEPSQKRPKRTAPISPAHAGSNTENNDEDPVIRTLIQYADISIVFNILSCILDFLFSKFKKIKCLQVYFQSTRPEEWNDLEDEDHDNDETDIQAFADSDFYD